jgi:hypothetical protein
VSVLPEPLYGFRNRGGAVAVYDLVGPEDIGPFDVAIKFGPANTVARILISGEQGAAGLAIAISGFDFVDAIKDGRKNAVDVALIAADCPIGLLKLNGGMYGVDVNGEVLGGIFFPADIDGDGDTSDATALYCSEWIGTAQFRGTVDGDVWLGGTDPNGFAVQKFQIRDGGYHGDFFAFGAVKILDFGGDFGSSIWILGSLSKFKMKNGDFDGKMEVLGDLDKFDLGGDMLAGSGVAVGGTLGKFNAKGSLNGGSSEANFVQVFANFIEKFNLKGSVTYARILAGAFLGDDWMIGGGGGDADTFGYGTIDKVAIKGNAHNTLIGAGVDEHAGKIDLDWLASNDAFHNGSMIQSVKIGGALTLSAGSGKPCGIGAFDIGTVKLGGLSDWSLVVTEV